MESCHSSQLSTASSSCSLPDMCRICHCEGGGLLSPCCCAGSMRYVHQSCLQQWIQRSGTRCCELCKFPFIMDTKVKPFKEWEKPDFSPIERRQLRCSIICLLLTILCVSWSLIKRTVEKIENNVDWWIKLIFDAIGLTAALVLIILQFRVFGKLFRRWMDFNRIVYVQNAIDNGHVDQAVVFSAADELTTRISTREETQRLSAGEEEFHNHQNNSDSFSSSTHSVHVHDATNSSGKLAEKGSTKLTGSRSVPVEGPNHPLCDTMIVSTITDPTRSASAHPPMPSLSKQPPGIDVEIL